MKYYRVENLGHSIFILEVYVLKTTPRGVWVELPYSTTKRFVLAGARKRYAWPTKEEAIESFKARKRRQIKILKAQLRIAAMLLKVASEEDKVLLERGNVYIGSLL